jgi:hypothetical protein
MLLAMLVVSVGDLVFQARFEAAAEKTVSALVSRLPMRSKIIQARWSGEAAWVPMGALDLGVALENATSYPAPGHLLFYPGGHSETEILFAYGATCFASRLGQLAGSHFATVIEGNERLGELGRRVLWEGAQEIGFELTGC